MKTGCKLLSLLLSLCMLLSCVNFPITVHAAEGAANATLTVDKTSVSVGETVTVVISNGDLTASLFGVYLEFDNTLLECTSISGTDDDEWFGVYYAGKKGARTWVDAAVADTVDETNSDGIYSFGVLNLTGKEWTIYAGNVATLTFTAVKDGTVNFTLTEKTSGADAFDGIAATATVTIGGTSTPACDHEGKAYTYEANNNGTHKVKCECGEYKTESEPCSDETTKDHNCDNCGYVMSTCSDKAGDDNHNCDVCNAANVSDHSYGNASCETPATCTECGATTGTALGHKDANTDHICDNGCGKSDMGEHKDSPDDKDHVCDYCKKGEALETCSDAAGDGNHNCDICGKADVTGHEYGEADCNAPATCTECGATTGTALGHKDDNHDHNCDNGCGKTDMGEHKSNAAYPCLDGICEYCQTAMPATAEHTGDKTACTGKKECTVCGTAYATANDHGQGKGFYATPNSNGTHNERCGDCNGLINENVTCSPADGKCTLCGYCKHTGTFRYPNNDDGTHNVVCNICDTTTQEKVTCSDETTKDHKCDDCGYVMSECFDGEDPNHDCDVCSAKNIEDHTKGSPVQENIEKATCEAAGSYDEVIYCTECGAVVSRENKAIDALGHEWGDTTYTWSEDGKSCTAKHVCARDAAHEETETVATTGKITTPATCTEKGTTTYTANFEAEWAADGQTKEVQDIPATEHSWTVSYAWAQENGAWYCTATRTCGNDAKHNLTEKVAATGKVTTPATCTEKGTTTYTANFEAEWAVDGQTKEVQDIPANNHSFTNARGSLKTAGTCTAEAVYAVKCNNCSVESAELTVKGEKDASNHTSTQYNYTIDGKTHSAAYKCCGATYVTGEAHNYSHDAANHKCVCGAVELFLITLDANGGKFSNGEQTYSKGVEYGVTFDAVQYPTKDGCKFMGWNTEADGSGETIDLTPSTHIVTANITVYAQWCDHATTKAVSNGDGKTHKIVCTNEACGETVTELVTCVGGTATCTQKPVCAACNTAYGDINENNHASDEVAFKNITDTTHDEHYACCGALKAAGVDHTYNENHKCDCGAKLTGWEGKTYFVDGVMQTGWTKVDDAWYFFDTTSGVRTEGMKRLPYLTELGYKPNQEDIDYAANKGIAFKDATEAWFYFGQDGKLMTGFTGILDGKYVQNGMIAWHPGFVQVNGEWYYFVGDADNGGNKMANGQIYVTRNAEAAGYETKDQIVFVNGKVDTTVNGIVTVEGVLYYYENGKLMAGNGLTKIGDKYIYVRSSGKLAVGDYYIPANKLGVVSALYTFGEDGLMVMPKFTNVNGVVDGYYYKDGKVQYGAGLIKWNGDIYYVRSNGQVATGWYYVTNINEMEGFQTGMKLNFGEDGKMQPIKNGIVKENGELYYYENNRLQCGAGLIEWNGDIYYVRSTGKVQTGYFYITNTNGLKGFKPGDHCKFGEDGKLIQNFGQK